MAELDKTIIVIESWLNQPVLTPPPINDLYDALELLKEQNEQKKQILKAVWDVLHEGVSTDTVADQDWVYEQIRNRVDKMY